MINPKWFTYEFQGTPTKEGDILTMTVQTITIACCRCGKNEPVTIKSASDVIYLDDVMKELGWTKDKFNRWFCNECSYKGGDD